MYVLGMKSLEILNQMIQILFIFNQKSIETLDQMKQKPIFNLFLSLMWHLRIFQFFLHTMRYLAEPHAFLHEISIYVCMYIHTYIYIYILMISRKDFSSKNNLCAMMCVLTVGLSQYPSLSLCIPTYNLSDVTNFEMWADLLGQQTNSPPTEVPNSISPQHTFTYLIVDTLWCAGNCKYLKGPLIWQLEAQQVVRLPSPNGLHN